MKRDVMAAHSLALSGSIVLLAAAAWLALWTMGGSAHAAMHGHHHHAGMTGAGVTPAPVMFLFFVSSWTVMTIAMMLPTSLPVLTTFHVVAGTRRDRPLLIGLVVVGYLFAWALFGAGVHVAQVGLQRVAAASTWVEQRAWVSGGAILILAGIYQFTPLK